MTSSTPSIPVTSQPLPGSPDPATPSLASPRTPRHYHLPPFPPSCPSDLLPQVPHPSGAETPRAPPDSHLVNPGPPVTPSSAITQLCDAPSHRPPLERRGGCWSRPHPSARLLGRVGVMSDSVLPTAGSSAPAGWGVLGRVLSGGGGLQGFSPLCLKCPPACCEGPPHLSDAWPLFNLCLRDSSFWLFFGYLYSTGSRFLSKEASRPVMRSPVPPCPVCVCCGPPTSPASCE